MTAQHETHENPTLADAEHTDPLGPINLPKHGKVGARALALIGTASIATLAVYGVVDTCGTFTSIES
jgi:hypothetical protein